MSEKLDSHCEHDVGDLRRFPWDVLPGHVVAALSANPEFLPLLQEHAHCLDLFDGGLLLRALDCTESRSRLTYMILEAPTVQRKQDAVARAGLEALQRGADERMVKTWWSPHHVSVQRLPLWPELANAPPRVPTPGRGPAEDFLQFWCDAEDRGAFLAWVAPLFPRPWRKRWEAMVGTSLDGPMNAARLNVWLRPKRRLSKPASARLESCFRRWAELSLSAPPPVGGAAGITSIEHVTLHGEASVARTLHGKLEELNEDIAEVNRDVARARTAEAQAEPRARAAEMYARLLALMDAEPDLCEVRVGPPEHPRAGLHVVIDLGAAGQEGVLALFAMLVTCSEEEVPIEWIVLA